VALRAQRGLEEGRKDRPCVILIAVKRQQSDTVVVALPITHCLPEKSDTAIEMPQAVKQHVGLDLERSWVMVNEANQFTWPGYDLRKISGTNDFRYGMLPPRFFGETMQFAWIAKAAK
jgi:hypothetical protein